MVRLAFSLHHYGAFRLGDVSCWLPAFGRYGRFGAGFVKHRWICVGACLLARLLQFLTR